ncbi:MAG: hypothetical protein P1U74_06780 [Legionellaceae bacterium]|nr:hypothetical protein [Legionellaceae bacterium]
MISIFRALGSPRSSKGVSTLHILNETPENWDEYKGDCVLICNEKSTIKYVSHDTGESIESTFTPPANLFYVCPYTDEVQKLWTGNKKTPSFFGVTPKSNDFNSIIVPQLKDKLSKQSQESRLTLNHYEFAALISYHTGFHPLHGERFQRYLSPKQILDSDEIASPNQVNRRFSPIIPRVSTNYELGLGSIDNWGHGQKPC